MTLNTRIYVRDEVNPHELFHELRRLVGATEQHVYTDQERTFFGDGGDGSWELRNHAWQGLPALLDVRYLPGEALRAADDWSENDPACWVEASMDTTYSYRDEYGGCGHLHARLLARLGQWFADRDISWVWKNEYNGEHHDGADRERYADLIGTSEDAARWMESILPSILAGEGRSR